MNDLLAEIIKPYLLSIVSSIDKGDHWASVGMLLIGALLPVAVGYGLSWFLQTRKLQHEIRNSDAEAKQKEFDLLTKVHALRNDYAQKVILAQLQVQLCIDDLQKNQIDSLGANRRELIDLFFNEVAPLFSNYLEAYEVINKSSRSKMQSSIEADVLPFLDLMSTMIGAVNNQIILGAISSSAEIIRPFVLQPVVGHVKSTVPFYRICKRSELKKQFNAVLRDAWA